MCGRFAIAAKPEDLRRLFGYAEQPNFPPRYNIAPTQPVPVVVVDRGRRHFVLMRWGFIPGWVKDPKDFPLVFNIRKEGAREKASFRAAFIRRRALMPADGFYEWRKEARGATPFLVRRRDGAPFAFPALWETWVAPDGGEIDTAALITTAAEGEFAAIHPRVPAILPEERWEAWLDPATPPDKAEALLGAPQGEFEFRRIGPAVNKVENDGPEVQEAATEAPSAAPKPAARPKAKPRPDEGQGSLF